ncbi:hypothetical protein [Metabacillus malikii]|uniref:Uncharacterized protein n=1 Tax=Metabacillus malikii TaxID=1504265 RepID=A0ABT9ZHQ5_9BACI|nr:hypothetical protein [Metabacillus malikii]MDQ0231823.1 hypothetical protein [Metabacillus malikii]
MTVNHASVLSANYFDAYFNLVIKSRDFTIYEAKEFIIQHFFKGDLHLYGEDTYKNFTLVYDKLIEKY